MTETYYDEATGMKRSSAIANGIIHDYSEAGRTAGLIWPVAITDQLEAHLLAGVPEGIRLPTPITPASLAGLNLLMNMMASHIFTQAAVHLTVAGSDPARKGESTIDFTTNPPWSVDKSFRLKLLIGPDDNGEPCFLIDGELIDRVEEEATRAHLN